MVELILLALATLAGSFFCSLSEAALLSASEARVRSRMEAGDRRAARLLEIKQDPARTLAAIVFLNNLFAVAGTGLLTAVADTIIPPGLGMVGFLIGWTFLVIAFGEITPKVLGEALPEPIAGAVAPLLQRLRVVMTPLIVVVEFFVSWARPKSRVMAGEEEEIRELARLGEEQGHIDADEAELIRRVFRLDDITAGDVMTPRKLVLAFRGSDTLEDIREDLLSTSHFYFPIYEEDLDHVTGILRLRDALADLARGHGHRQVKDLGKKPLFLPVSRKVDDVLHDLQKAHGFMAVVIDEYGVTEGVVTMDDLVEELVGEALDDSDVSVGLVKRLSRKSALVHGLTRVRDIARFLNCPVEYENDEQENTTITGLFQEQLGRIPVQDDQLVLPPGLRLVVRTADARSAARVYARNEFTPETPTEAP